MCCTIDRVQKEVKSANIGKPFSTASFNILARDSLYILPKLGYGELCIGGPQLAREYHNNPKLTKEKFIRMGSQRMYRTGDYVRMLANGTFEFIGRLDDQVKIRGLRVELDEINHVIKRSHHNIQGAVTVVLKHSPEAKEQLVSFLGLGEREVQAGTPAVIEDGQKKGEILNAAREAATQALPAYMIPGFMILIDHIPLSAAGKVDKKVLTSLFTAQAIDSLGESSTEDEGVEWTKAELKVREIMAELSQLPVNRITKSSTIYQLGLDSISAAQVAMRLRREGFKLTVIDILEVVTLNSLY